MKLFAALLLGLLVYLGLNLGVLRKPLTIGYIRAAYDAKLAYAAKLGETPKIVVVGGSSSLFGVRCQIIARETHMPCVNMAVTAGIGIDLMLTKALGAIKPGDMVIVPLEYDLYTVGADGVAANATANSYLATYDHGLLLDQSAARILHAAFSLTMQDAYSSGVEMALQGAGIERRFTVAMLTEQGDMTGHTPDKALAYADYVRSQPFIVPGLGPGGDDTEGMRQIRAFIAKTKQIGARVWGTYPTIIDDGTPPAPGFAQIAEVWTNAGAGFLTPPNLGRYPRADFYDTVYHLAEPYQIEHSRMIAALLVCALRPGSSPAYPFAKAKTVRAEPRHSSGPTASNKGRPILSPAPP